MKTDWLTLFCIFVFVVGIIVYCCYCDDPDSPTVADVFDDASED